jgi:hypothetical protein
MLSNGLLWHDGGSVISFMSSVIEKLSTIKFMHDSKPVNSSCFLYEFLSSDNFEHIFETYLGKMYSSGDLDSIGLHLGKEIKKFKTTYPSGKEYPFSIIRDIKSCMKLPKKGTVYILKKFKNEHCNTLAPNLKFKVKECVAVRVVVPTGGSIGDMVSLGIYALADVKSKGLSIVPLKYFSRLELLKHIAKNRSDTYYKPSFECSIKLKKREYIICASDVLSKLDQELSVLYRDAKFQDKVNNQRKWLRELDNCPSEGSHKCLEDKYSQRIKFFRLQK